MTKLSHQNPKGTYIVFASMGRSKGGRVTNPIWCSEGKTLLQLKTAAI